VILVGDQKIRVFVETWTEESEPMRFQMAMRTLFGIGLEVIHVTL
jgi:hypothetical protein